MTRHTEKGRIYKFAIRCPVCRRKLMTVRRSQNTTPNAVIIDPDSAGIYGEETRCPGCHCYVGITI